MVFPKALCWAQCCSLCIQHHLHYNCRPQWKTMKCLHMTHSSSHSESPDNYSNLVLSLWDCIKDTRMWMDENKLELNNNKKRKLFVSHPPLLSRLPYNSHVHFFSVIPKLSFLETSITSAPSSTVIFQWNNTSSKHVYKAAYIEIGCTIPFSSISLKIQPRN